MMHFFFVIISSRNWVTLTTINCCQNEPNQIIELNYRSDFFIKYACTISDEILPKSYTKKEECKMKALTYIFDYENVNFKTITNLDAKNSLDLKRALKNDVI